MGDENIEDLTGSGSDFGDNEGITGLITKR